MQTRKMADGVERALASPPRGGPTIWSVGKPLDACYARPIVVESIRGICIQVFQLTYNYYNQHYQQLILMLTKIKSWIDCRKSNATRPIYLGNSSTNPVQYFGLHLHSDKLTVTARTGIRTRSLVIETIVVATAAGVVERHAAVLRSAKRPGRVLLCAVAWLLWQRTCLCTVQPCQYISIDKLISHTLLI